MKKLIIFSFISKIWKTILLGYLVIFSSFFAFADTWSLNDVKLSVSENTVKIDESFDLKFTINLSDTGNIWDITINWIDNFKSFWETSSFSFQDINGVKKWIYNMTVTLKPINLWKFSIWPAIIKLWDKTIQSNIVEIEVFWNDITSSWSLIGTWGTDEETGLHDIKWPKSYFSFSFWFILTFLVFLFFTWYHYLIKYYISWKDDVVVEKIKEEKPKDKKDYFLDKLNLIEEKADIYDKSEFFGLVNDFLRELLEYKWLVWAYKMTFKELDKHREKIDSKLFKIIENTYFEEFRETESITDRKEIIDEIRKNCI